MYRLLFVGIVLVVVVVACTSDTLGTPRVRTFANSMELAIENQDRGEMLRLCELGDERFLSGDASRDELKDWGMLIAVCDRTINQDDWGGASSELETLLG